MGHLGEHTSLATPRFACVLSIDASSDHMLPANMQEVEATDIDQHAHNNDMILHHQSS